MNDVTTSAPSGQPGEAERVGDQAQYQDIGLDEIIIAGGRRAIDQEKVEALAESIRTIGLQHPIGVVARNGSDKYRLLHGAHRIPAVKLLGWKTISAIVHDLDDLHAELAEIDENLVRCPLTQLEESRALARRKQIYEALHPETKRGQTKERAKVKRQHAALPPSFTEDTTAKTGKSTRPGRRRRRPARRSRPRIRNRTKDRTRTRQQPVSMRYTPGSRQSSSRSTSWRGGPRVRICPRVSSPSSWPTWRPYYPGAFPAHPARSAAMPADARFAEEPKRFLRTSPPNPSKCRRMANSFLRGTWPKWFSMS